MGYLTYIPVYYRRADAAPQPGLLAVVPVATGGGLVPVVIGERSVVTVAHPTGMLRLGLYAVSDHWQPGALITDLGEHESFELPYSWQDLTMTRALLILKHGALFPIPLPLPA